MSWLDKLLPPKISHTDPSERRSVPEGLWIKCPSCEAVLYKTDLEKNQNVCPQCSHHHRLHTGVRRPKDRPGPSFRFGRFGRDRDQRYVSGTDLFSISIAPESLARLSRP